MFTAQFREQEKEILLKRQQEIREKLAAKEAEKAVMPVKAPAKEKPNAVSAKPKKTAKAKAPKKVNVNKAKKNSFYRRLWEEGQVDADSLKHFKSI
ncbi:hypothetical protein [Enterobacter roggenkampii]|uniref:hypothetical protein n=1 Tax=Enterobacter roggenkampii TaxID=1812935 RepID=UPI001C704872|nr:hypothetical protein [Enterobacter roggenkampii]MBW9466544.1 hypothetical protein [Enterobacter roggenkampii]